VRKNFDGEIHSLYDLNPEYRPALLEFSLGRAPGHRFVDAVSNAGLSALGLPASYPLNASGGKISHARCRAIGFAAYESDEAGIACRSAAESRVASWVGEELALFDRAAGLAAAGKRRGFAAWYPIAK
jgi:hypothetical protein